MPTPADSLRNLRTLRGNVAAQLGVDPQNLTADQIRPYNQAMAKAILSYPNSFTAETLAIAREFQTTDGRADQVLGATQAFSIDDAFSEIAGKVETLIKTLLIIGAIGAVAYFVLPKVLAKPVAP